MSGATLDHYLAKGWYRMGQGIFTCHFLCFGERIYSAIWLRLSLKDYTFRKSLRKVIKRNQQFKTLIRPAQIDKQKEILYQRYRWYSFKGNISTSLQESLQDGGHTNIYNTYESCVYDGDKLVAVSFFDLGDNSIASILGMYDPDYAGYSLGFYTMLVEIQYGQAQQFDYYYPGYIVPGYERFDYKM
ncbi:MAG: arginine-tRNA-protein transferase, partial [Bacteroidota bacterium]